MIFLNFKKGIGDAPRDRKEGGGIHLQALCGTPLFRGPAQKAALRAGVRRRRSEGEHVPGPHGRAACLGDGVGLSRNLALEIFCERLAISIGLARPPRKKGFLCNESKPTAGLRRDAPRFRARRGAGQNRRGRERPARPAPLPPGLPKPTEASSQESFLKIVYFSQFPRYQMYKPPLNQPP